MHWKAVLLSSSLKILLVWRGSAVTWINPKVPVASLNTVSIQETQSNNEVWLLSFSFLHFPKSIEIWFTVSENYFLNFYFPHSSPSKIDSYLKASQVLSSPILYILLRSWSSLFFPSSYISIILSFFQESSSPDGNHFFQLLSLPLLWVVWFM